MSERNQTKRWRCLAVGCNPVLDEATAAAHHTATGHRVAKWPIRSSEGKARARKRNKAGYYDKYNVGAKSAQARGLTDSAHRNRSNRDDEAMSEYMDAKEED